MILKIKKINWQPIQGRIHYSLFIFFRKVIHWYYKSQRKSGKHTKTYSKGSSWKGRETGRKGGRKKGKKEVRDSEREIDRGRNKLLLKFKCEELSLTLKLLTNWILKSENNSMEKLVFFSTEEDPENLRGTRLPQHES